MVRLEWRVYEAGHCLHPEWSTRSGASLRPCAFPALVVLLRHPVQGWILFDTGYSEHFRAATARMPERLYPLVTPVRLRDNESVRAQLLRDGVDPDAVRWIVLSHLHGDHVGGVADFPAARVVLAREAWDAMRSHSRIGALRTGVLPALLAGRDPDALEWIEDRGTVDLVAPFEQFGRGFDLFGDASLVLVALPGHAPGHYGAVFDDGQGPVFLVADASWSTQAIRDNMPPPRLTTAWMGDTTAYRLTLARLHALHRDAPHVRLVPSHCHEWRPAAALHGQSGLVPTLG